MDPTLRKNRLAGSGVEAAYRVDASRLPVRTATRLRRDTRVTEEDKVVGHADAALRVREVTLLRSVRVGTGGVAGRGRVLVDHVGSTRQRCNQHIQLTLAHITTHAYRPSYINTRSQAVTDTGHTHRHTRTGRHGHRTHTSTRTPRPSLTHDTHVNTHSQAVTDAGRTHQHTRTGRHTTTRAHRP